MVSCKQRHSSLCGLYNFCFYKTILHVKNKLRKYIIMCFNDFENRPHLLWTFNFFNCHPKYCTSRIEFLATWNKGHIFPRYSHWKREEFYEKRTTAREDNQHSKVKSKWIMELKSKFKQKSNEKGIKYNNTEHLTHYDY